MSEDGMKKLEDLTRALNEPKSELDELFDGTTLLLAVISNNGYFKRVSPSWTKLLGWSVKEMCSRPWNDFMHPDDILASDTAFASRLSGKPQSSHVNRYRATDGTYKTINWIVPDTMAKSGHSLAIAIVLPEEVSNVQQK